MSSFPRGRLTFPAGHQPPFRRKLSEASLGPGALAPWRPMAPAMPQALLLRWSWLMVGGCREPYPSLCPHLWLQEACHTAKFPERQERCCTLPGLGTVWHPLGLLPLLLRADLFLAQELTSGGFKIFLIARVMQDHGRKISK